MEVHAHTHTERKKWIHYFWEFLMLFLAVFCGFLTENFREGQVEHHREKEYMASLMSQKFGEGNVRFDPVVNSLNIFMTPNMVGIKDISSK